MNASERIEALERLIPVDYMEHAIARLAALLATWDRTGNMPEGVGVLSSGEYTALVVAAAHEELLGPSPVAKFLLLDGWLQKWVFENRGWQHFIGSRIGV